MRAVLERLVRRTVRELYAMLKPCCGRPTAGVIGLLARRSLPHMQHPSGIPEKIVNKVVARRGRLHAFETIDPKSTALVVIDLDEATVGPDGTWPRVIANV